MRTFRGVLWTVVLLAACGGEGALGDPCDTSGATDEECESGTICGKYRDDATELSCLKICNDQADCNQAAGEACNGVDGSNIKGCRL